VKQFISILFFLPLLAQTFSMSFKVAAYYINNTAYVKNCVNKEKPKLKCNGKCQLVKQIQEEEKQSQETPLRKTDNRNEIFSSRSYPPRCTITALFKSITHNSCYPSGNAVGIAISIFHPPE